MLAGTSAVATTPGDDATSTSAVQAFADPETEVGTSTLRRSADEVQATFHSTGIEPGYAITLWWVVFNQPESCSAPGCGEDDIFVGGDPANGPDADAIANAGVVAAYAAGTVTSADGQVWMAARLAEGVPGTDDIVGEGTLLNDAEAAEIHLVARSHGPSVADVALEQWTSYASGCETNLLPPEVADAEGECSDVQFAVHQP